MKAILAVIGAVLAVYLTIQISTMYKAKTDLQNRVEQRLDLVDDTSIDSVKSDLIADAKKLGIDLTPGNINIVYADTEQTTYAQKLVGGKLGAEFQNKQVGINIEYDARALGWPIHQQVTASKIKQIAAPALPPQKAVQELLDSQP